jgi:hypothetical protein
MFCDTCHSPRALADLCENAVATVWIWPQAADLDRAWLPTAGVATALGHGR